MCKYCEDASARVTVEGKTLTIFEPVIKYGLTGRTMAAVVSRKSAKRCDYYIYIEGSVSVKISHCPWCGRRLENDA